MWNTIATKNTLNEYSCFSVSVVGSARHVVCSETCLHSKCTSHFFFPFISFFGWVLFSFSFRSFGSLLFPWNVHFLEKLCFYALHSALYFSFLFFVFCCCVLFLIGQSVHICKEFFVKVPEEGVSCWCFSCCVRFSFRAPIKFPFSGCNTFYSDGSFFAFWKL